MSKKRVLTEADAARVCRWFADKMGMQDWEFDVYVDDSPPDWCGAVPPGILGTANPDLRFKKSLVWVAPGRHATRREALTTLLHELLHAVAEDVGIKGDMSDRKEYLWDRLGEVLAAAFEKE